MSYNDRADGGAPNPEPNVVLDRLSAQFGEDAIRPLVESFAAMLTDALRSLDAGNGRDVAHRVAGVAGTLGFSDVGQRWLALAEGAGDDLDRLRSTSVHALAIIADRHPICPEDKTSV